jgi:hypothetical protein
MTSNQSDTRGSKVKEPESFSGSDPHKLQTFLFQCQVNFEDRPRSFPNGHKKVLYMLSYMTGDALAWFEPHLINPTTNLVPAWFHNYDLFVQELSLNFGPFQPIAEAESNLENLRMRDGDRIQRFLVLFNRNAIQCQWGERALAYTFYKALPDRIQDALHRLPSGRPTTLSELRLRSMEIDARYWERKGELAKRTKNQDSSQGNRKPPQSSNTSSSGNSGSSSSGNHSKSPDNKKKDNRKPFNGSNNRSSGSTPAPSGGSVSSGPSVKPYSKVLDANGKLTAAERAKRIKMKECLFCGEKDHVLIECPKRNTFTKARAATTSKPASASKPDTSSPKVEEEK